MRDLKPYRPASMLPVARRDLSLAVPDMLDAECPTEVDSLHTAVYVIASGIVRTSQALESRKRDEYLHLRTGCE